MKSSEVRDSIANLIMLGCISVDEEVVGFTEDNAEVIHRSYSLTLKGKRIAEKFIGKLPEETRKTLFLLRRFNEMPLSHLNNYCAVKYGKKGGVVLSLYQPKTKGDGT